MEIALTPFENRLIPYLTADDFSRSSCLHYFNLFAVCGLTSTMGVYVSMSSLGSSQFS